MDENIKGIFHLTGESELFNKVANKTEQSIGVKLSADWELDTVTLFLEDKDENLIGSFEFDCMDFFELVDEVSPPTIEELKNDEENLTDLEKEGLEEELKEDLEYMKKNPIKKEINRFHS